jgi:hypothetical protein
MALLLMSTEKVATGCAEASIFLNASLSFGVSSDRVTNLFCSCNSKAIFDSNQLRNVGIGDNVQKVRIPKTQKDDISSWYVHFPFDQIELCN